MITKETAAMVWECYREIGAAEKLLKDIEEQLERNEKSDAPTLKDVFGRNRQLQLGIPCGEASHQLYNVQPKLATSVITAHIAAKKAELVTLNERVKIEMNSPSVEAIPASP